jgi:branched-chain amino acid aminotransferase
LMLSQDGHVSEASAANLFIIRGGCLITPPVTEDILEGITRATIVRLAKDRGHGVLERRIDRSELYVADEIFVCGTAVGVVPVVEVDHRPIGGGRIGPIGKQMREDYLTAVRGTEPRHHSWCTPVYLAV